MHVRLGVLTSSSNSGLGADGNGRGTTRWRSSRLSTLLLAAVLASGASACGGSSAAAAPDAAATVTDAGTDRGTTGPGSNDAGTNVQLGDAGLGSEAGCADGGCYVVVDAGPYCGDGIVQTENGEACDDGARVAGDGCSGICKVEPNFTCPTPGQPCVSTIQCGNGVREAGEACDDGNTKSGDGCSATCGGELGWYCPTPGQPCLTLGTCGDGRQQGDEACDLGADNGTGKGCDAHCALEPGWICKGHTCKQVPVCGDGKVAVGEECDEGATPSGTGCCSNCRVTGSYCSCPSTGGVCVDNSRCGNGIIENAETCDDGDTDNGDGCSSTCKVETGWECRMAGKPCIPDCGDGVMIGIEQCDDGNENDGDGCTNVCLVEPGYSCSGTPSVCKGSVCGNGIVEAGEGCDTKDVVPFDGCSPNCQNEPRCGTYDAQGKPTSAVGACKSVCGDGILLPGAGEECDDGNTLDNDGCSKDCQQEDGYTCVSAYDNPPPSLEIPIVLRDFAGYRAGSPPTGHPDFLRYCCNEQKGIVQPLLDPERKPVYSGTDAAPVANTTSKTAFDQWYRDASGVNQTFYGTLVLQRTNAATHTYVMNSDTDEPWYGRCGFYPLEDTPVTITEANNPNYGKVNVYCLTGGSAYNTDPASCPTTDPNNPNRLCYIGAGWGFGNEWLNHNYGFTSELRYWFTYQGNENLTFTGDDDVWVFVNGTQAVDLGGVHNRGVAHVKLDASNGTGQVGYGETPGSWTSVDFKLQTGSVYEVVVFQAERWCCGSNYMLTLANFLAGRSTCKPTCGNSIVTAGEECDTGSANADGLYNGCTTQCKFGPFCGDGVVNGSELCDDGRNTTVGYNVSGCGPGCKPPPRCGDGTVNPGEECDEGAANQDGQCGGCSTSCQPNALCGDALVDSQCGEECDDGANSGGYGFCQPGCKWGPRCGDGQLQTEEGEQCDEGSLNGQPGHCPATCVFPGNCGDGAIQAELGETCDDGKNDGSCGGCTPTCQLAPYCGDGLTQKDCGEECDYGAANTPPANAEYGGCLVTCKLGPHCGDSEVQRPAEQCDLGANNGGPGYDCSASCIQLTQVQ